MGSFRVRLYQEGGHESKGNEKLTRKTDADGNQNKYEEVCESWNALCTSKLKEVMQAGRDAFTWQTRQDTVEAQKGANFSQWLKPRQIALRPLLWEVSAMRTHASNEATRPPTTASLASVYIDSNSIRATEARVEGARSAIIFARQGAVIPFTKYTHTLKHTNHHRCQGRL